jgi:hypothetical protein
MKKQGRFDPAATVAQQSSERRLNSWPNAARSVRDALGRSGYVAGVGDARGLVVSASRSAGKLHRCSESFRGRRADTALFWNAARAHELRRADESVVLCFAGHGRERRCTVVTATCDAMRVLTIVQGRYDECLEHDRRGGRLRSNEHWQERA